MFGQFERIFIFFKSQNIVSVVPAHHSIPRYNKGFFQSWLNLFFSLDPVSFLFPEVHVVEGGGGDSRANASACVDDVLGGEGAPACLFLLQKEGEVHACGFLLSAFVGLFLLERFQIFALLQ
jgi:hypothetical protein